MLDAAHSLVIHGLVRPPPRYEVGGGTLVRRSVLRYRTLFGSSSSSSSSSSSITAAGAAGGEAAAAAAAVEREFDGRARRDHFAVQRRLFLGALRLQEAAEADEAHHWAEEERSVGTGTGGSGGARQHAQRTRRARRRRREEKRRQRGLLQLGGGGGDDGVGAAAPPPFTLKFRIESTSWRENGGSSGGGVADASNGGDSGFVCFVVRVDFAGVWEWRGGAPGAAEGAPRLERSWRIETRYSALDKLRSVSEREEGA